MLTLAADEMELLQQLMSRPRWRDRFQGKSVGYGLESGLALLAPSVILTTVWARSVVADEARKVMEPRLRAITRLVFRAKAEVQPPLPPAEPRDPEALRRAVATYARQLGCDEQSAELLGDAVVGVVLAPRA